MTSTASVGGAGEIWLVHLSSKRPEPGTIERVGLADVSRTSTLTVIVSEDDSTVRLLEQRDLPPGELAELGEQHVEATALALTDLLSLAPGAVVLAAVDRVVQLASWDVVQVLGQVVVTDTLDGAARVVAMLRAGTDLDEVLSPPGFSVGLSVADAGIGRRATSETLVLVDQGPIEQPAFDTGHVDRDLVDQAVVDKDLVDQAVVDQDPVDQDPVDHGPVDHGPVDHGPVDHGPVDQPPPSPDSSWLTIRGQEIEVRTGGMSPRAARAVTARQGTRRRVVEDAPRRLVMGTANYAGQGGEWVKAVREHAPGWTARNVHVVPPGAPLVFGADLPLTTTEWADPATRLDLAVELVVGATDIVIEAMRPLLAVGDGSEAANATDTRRAREDIEALRVSGRNVGLVFHGSELRRPRDHARLTPWSPFFQAQTKVLTASLERKTELVHEILAHFDGPVFVSTPDLLDFLPRSVWVPVVVGSASFAPAPPALTGGRPVVAHAPSSSWLKGSEWIDPVLQRLDAEGLLTYRRVENIAPIMMPSLLREVDVVVDQVVLGNPGVLAAQALAAGRLVLAHLPEPVRRRFAEPLPVVEATPATLEQVLLSVIEDPEHYRQIAASGVEFARTYHDGRMSARVLTEAMG